MEPEAHHSDPPRLDAVTGARIGGISGALVGGGMLVLFGWAWWIPIAAAAGAAAGWTWERR